MQRTTAAARRKSAEKTADDPMSVDSKPHGAAASVVAGAPAVLSVASLPPPPLPAVNGGVETPISKQAPAQVILPGAPTRPAPPVPDKQAPAVAALPPMQVAPAVAAVVAPLQNSITPAAQKDTSADELAAAIKEFYILDSAAVALAETRLADVYGACPAVFKRARLVFVRNIALWKETLNDSFLLARSTAFGKDALAGGVCYKFLFVTCVGLLHTHIGAAEAQQYERGDFAAWQDDARALARAIKREAALIRCPVEVAAGDGNTVKIDFAALWE
jgi:hypothetical protein